jgi:histidine kinase
LKYVTDMANSGSPSTGRLARLTPIFRQLRWRIIAGHMIVVVVGVLVLVLMSELFILWATPTILNPDLTPESTTTTTQVVADSFRNAILRAVLVAAVSAIIAGLLTSVFLAREILHPLNQIAFTSRRIAEGRYNERVAIPPSTELATVATNFNEMAETLEQMEKTRIQLISNVMHELRTPLTGLEGYLEGLMDGLFASEPETFAQMSQEVRRLKRLVNDLQALSKVQSGQITLHIEPFNLIPVIDQVVSQLKPQAVAQYLQIEVINSPSEIMVQADRDRTAQVLVNILGNAIRYTPDSGSITISLTTTDYTVKVAVSDNGIGLPAEALPYIFERFYRVDRSRSRASGGSGIGLTISRHLAWAMAGDLTAASDGPDKGSTFTLSLPLAT